jgi:hypothetical protein
MVVAEARFDDSALRTTPSDAVFLFTWPVRPHVDTLKEAKGTTERLANGTITTAKAMSDLGTTVDQHITSELATVAKYEAAGLPLPPHLVQPEPVAEPELEAVSG